MRMLVAHVLPVSMDMKSRFALPGGLLGPGAVSVSTAMWGKGLERGTLGL